MEKSKEVAGIIAGWFNAAAKGDATYPERFLSKRPATLLIGTDPKEWMHGAAVTRFLAAEAKAMGGNVKVKVGKVEGYAEGSVGWGVASPVITLPNGKDFQPRWSAVLHKEGKQWKIVQIHASVGVPNEQIMG